jgi:hypothetical protein
MPLLTLTIQSCASKPETEIILPPQPQRRELPEAKTMADIATTLNYYEHLVQEWEAWGETAERLISETPR